MRSRALSAAIAFGVGMLVLVGLPVAQASGPTPYPGGSYMPPKAMYGSAVEKNLSVRMSDGVVLKVDVTYPTNRTTGKRAAGPFPVILTQEAYQGSTTGVLSDVTSSDETYFAQRGYIAVNFDQRGTGGTLSIGGSQGTALLADPRIRLDTVQFAYWAADPRNLPDSNGKVGLAGCSALGISQIGALSTLGKLLREHGTVYVPGRTVDDPGHIVNVTKATDPIHAAIPACANADFYRDTFFDGGIPGGTWALFPAGPVFGVQTYDPTANLSPDTFLVDLLAGGDLGYDRQFWKQRDWLLQADDIARTGAPMLMWTGWNEPGGQGGQWLYAALQNATVGRPSYLPMKLDQKPSPKYQLIMGQWAHGGGLDPGIELEWYDTWLKGVHTGLRSVTKPLHIKEIPVASTSRWINVATYPMTSDYTPYYLDSGSTLSPTKPTQAGSETLPWAPVVNQTYTLTKPMTQDMTLIGPSAARVWVKSTNSNVELTAELVDVGPSGATNVITHGSILGSRKQIDRQRSWYGPSGLPIQPYLTDDADRPLTPNKAVRLDIPLQPQTWRLLKGHRLELWLGAQMPETQCVAALITRPGACLLTAPMVKTLPGGVYTILHGPAHPSLINVPLVPSSSLQTIRSGKTPTSAGVALPLGW